MPLPKTPFNISGGCNCGAIRYKISVPAQEERPVHFMYNPPFTNDTTAAQDEIIRMPMVITDHCNDCRSAVGSVLPHWMLTPANMFTMSCLPKSADDSPGPGTVNKSALTARGADDDRRPAFTSAHELLRGDDPGALASTWLRLYYSTDHEAKNKASGSNKFTQSTIRSFCGRCGTNLTYMAHPMPDWYGDYVDVVAGTVDREFLEQGWMKPERELWCKFGMDWVKEVSHLGLKVDRHDTYDVREMLD